MTVTPRDANVGGDWRAGAREKHDMVVARADGYGAVRRICLGYEHTARGRLPRIAELSLLHCESD